jgi:Methyltransferase domain
MNIARKWNTFKNDPVASISAKSQKVVPWLRHHHAFQQLIGTTVLESIKEFSSDRPTEALGPDYADLWFLYWNVRQRKPQIILEFGSGISTVCLAQALLENGSGRLYSVDDEERWATSTASSIPARLRALCDVRYSPVNEVPFPGAQFGVKFVDLPKVIPNFAYLDGPCANGPGRPAIDLLDMEDCFPTGFFLVIDGRDENTEVLRTHFKRRYRFQQRRIAKQPTFELVE